MPIRPLAMRSMSDAERRYIRRYLHAHAVSIQHQMDRLLPYLGKSIGVIVQGQYDYYKKVHGWLMGELRRLDQSEEAKRVVAKRSGTHGSRRAENRR